MLSLFFQENSQCPQIKCDLLGCPYSLLNPKAQSSPLQSSPLVFLSSVILYFCCRYLGDSWKVITH